MARPGVLFYFDTIPALDQLPYAAVGELMLKALHYARDGVEPVFEDGSLSFAWQFVKVSVDRDGAAYDEKRQRGDWLTYCRRCKRDGIEAVDFETWRERTVNATLHTDDVALPTTTTTPNPTSESKTNTYSAAKPPRASRFTPPTLQEVSEYCLERGNGVDPQRFIDYYTSNGWRVGKNPMRDWKAAVRTWERGQNTDAKHNSEYNQPRTERDFNIKYDNDID